MAVGPGRRARAAAARRARPAQPGCRARDDRRAGGRCRGVEVRDDRDGGDRRWSNGWRRRRRRAPAARRPPPRGLAARRGGRLARRGPARARRRRPAARRARRRSTRSTWAAASRSCRSDEPVPEPGAVRPGAPACCSRPCPTDRRPARLAIEPGRALVARAGWLVARVLHVRDRGGRQVVLDAGMTELIRPGAVRRPPPDRGADVARAARRRSRAAALDGGRRADARRGPDLRVDRRARRARPAAAAPRRPRGDRRRRRLCRVARLDLQRPARGRRRSSSSTDGGSGSPGARGRRRVPR